jgi:hypothetical protein
MGGLPVRAIYDNMRNTEDKAQRSPASSQPNAVRAGSQITKQEIRRIY